SDVTLASEGPRPAIRSIAHRMVRGAGVASAGITPTNTQKRGPDTVFLTADRRWVAMLNYPVSPELLEPLVPPGTAIDLWQGAAYVSVVGFLFERIRVLGLPLPTHRRFEEVNLRFYVVRDVAGELRHSVTFIR